MSERLQKSLRMSGSPLESPRVYRSHWESLGVSESLWESLGVSGSLWESLCTNSRIVKNIEIDETALYHMRLLCHI